MYAIQTCLLEEMFSQIMCSCRLYTHLFLHMITSNQKRTYSSPFLSLSTPLPSSSTWNRQFWHRGHITPATDTVSTMVHQSHREKPRNTRDHLYDTNPNNALFSGNASIFSIHVQLFDSKRMDNLLTLEYPRTKRLQKKNNSKPSNLPISGIPNSWKSKSIPRKSQYGKCKYNLIKLFLHSLLLEGKPQKIKHQPEKRWFNEIKKSKKKNIRKMFQLSPDYQTSNQQPPKGSLIPEPDWHIPLQQRLHNNPGVNQKV